MTTFWGRLCIAGVVIAWAGVAQAQGTPRRVAVYELTTSPGIDARTQQVVSAALLAEVRKLDRISAVGMKEIQEMLSFEEQRQMLGCGDESCLVEIAGALGVDELVTGSLGQLGDSHLLNVKRMDLGKAEVVGAVSHRLEAGDGEEFLAVIGDTVAEIYQGYLLRPGRERGVSRSFVQKLNPPPLPPWSVYAGIGATVAALGLGGFFVYQTGQSEDDYDSALQRALTETVPNRTLRGHRKDAQDAADRATITFAVAGALAVATGVAALFVDWSQLRGDADKDVGSGTAPRASARIVPGGLEVRW